MTKDQLINHDATIITVSQLMKMLNKIKREQILIVDNDHNDLHNEFNGLLRKRYREKIFALIYFYLEMLITKSIEDYECEAEIKTHLYEIYESYEILRHFLDENIDNGILRSEFYKIDFPMSLKKEENFEERKNSS